MRNVAAQRAHLPIGDLLTENRRFRPPDDFRTSANVSDPAVIEKANDDPSAFWSAWAAQLDWNVRWSTLLEWSPPHARWFVGGRMNAAWNCIDRHLPARKFKPAIIWESESGESRTLSYADLQGEVSRLANALRTLGVGEGDHVLLYMPMIPEAVVSMLACARIGAPHTVVFAGFSAEAVREQAVRSGAKAVITATSASRRGVDLSLKKIVDEAIAGLEAVDAVVVVQRRADEWATPMKRGRDHWYHHVIAAASSDAPCAWVDSEHPLFSLYTSGTTGRPKGVVHSTGGYLTAVHATTRWVFDLQENDVFWCTADLGWITGHSYVVYGPLSNGGTVVLFEGEIDWPSRDRAWKIIARHRVSVLYTAATTIRAFMSWGEQLPQSHDLSSLRLLGTVGETINPQAWMWFYKYVGGSRCPIVDTWWQTETGSIILAPLPGITTTKPGSATLPFPGVRVEVTDESGNRIETGAGYLRIVEPWPSMMRDIEGEPERFEKEYWTAPGAYITGDAAKRDAEGYFWLLGRTEDLIEIDGREVGATEIESAIVDHPAVAEAAVVAVRRASGEQILVAFVTVKESSKGRLIDDAGGFGDELAFHVEQMIGSSSRPDRFVFLAELPKTRSGKIMRRLLRDVAHGSAIGDLSTLADPGVVAELRRRYEERET